MGRNVAVLKEYQGEPRKFDKGAGRERGAGDAVYRAVEKILSGEAGAGELVGEERMAHFVAAGFAKDQHLHNRDVVVVDDQTGGEGLFFAGIFQYTDSAAVAFLVALL